MCRFKRRKKLAGSGLGGRCRENMCAVRQRLRIARGQQDFSIVVRGWFRDLTDLICECGFIR